MKKILAACLVCMVLWITCGGEEDSGLPQVEITSPADGSVVGGTVDITADATDDEGILTVEFYIDDSLASTDTTEPYAHSWVTMGLVDSSSHTIYAKAYDTDNNEATSQEVIVIVFNGFYLSDDFNSYQSSSPMDTTYALLDGNGSWSSVDWNVMREEFAFDSNYTMVREFPISPTNHATYHVTAQANIRGLTVGFTYIEDTNGELNVLISPDDSNWVDVTGEFNISTTTTPTITSADLAAFVAAYGQDAYIRFNAHASGGSNWYSAIDDFWVSGTIE
jgi:hypothetical protein